MDGLAGVVFRESRCYLHETPGRNSQMNETIKIKGGKIPTDTRLFNASQKVWLKMQSGDLSAIVCGKYRGSGRYVSGWINGKTAIGIDWKTMDVAADFAKRHGLAEYQ